MHAHRLVPCAAASLLALALPAAAQSPQKVSPPVAQAWIDVATFSGLGMPAGMAGAVANPLGALGSLFGKGGGGGNSFGNTQTGSSGRFVDVTLSTRNNPALEQAQQAVPAGFLSPALKLESPPPAPGSRPPPESDDEVVPQEQQRPKGRILMYWGCGAAIRAGQPQVIDAATASAADFARFFQSRRATQRGAHSAPGRPVWPSRSDARMVPDTASLAGEHGFSGSGVPEGFRFQIPAAQDLMPALELKQGDNAGATDLRWTASPQARGHFVAGMGAGGQDEMVIWTSSEQPEVGFGLIDYQTNGAVDRWVREKVLLGASTSSCTVPKGVFSGQGAMLRLIAYGNELNLAHPPRPTDPKVEWKPDWAVKVRVKSVATTMLGMADTAMGGEAPATPAEEKKPKALDILRGILGR